LISNKEIYFHTGMFTSSSAYVLASTIGDENAWNYYITDLSDRYKLGHFILGLNFDGDNYISNHEGLSGISDDVELTNNPENWIYHTESFQTSVFGDQGI